MDRRNLFSGLKNFGQLTRQALEEAKSQRSSIFRPPMAIEEKEFMSKCTRCNDCIDACEFHVPYQAFSPNSPNNLTPTMDPNFGPCEMCDDLPCVAACETGALVFPEKREEKYSPELKRVGIARIYIDHCYSWNESECDSCLQECPEAGALVLDSEGRMRIRESLCTGCGKCVMACPLSTDAIEIIPLTRNREIPAPE